MKKVIVINGKPRSGKDSLVHILQNEYNYDKEGCYKDVVWNVSSVDGIKHVAEFIGWNGSKSEKDRKFLSDLKILTTQYNDYPFRFMNGYVNDFKLSNNGKWLFLHIREPEEIKRAKEEFNAVTLYIDRNDADNITSNMADKHVAEYDYDYVIKNNGTINELSEKAFEFLSELERR